MPVRKLNDEELSRALSENAVGNMFQYGGRPYNDQCCLYQAADAVGTGLPESGKDASGTPGWRLFDDEWVSVAARDRTPERLLAVCRKIGAM